MTVLEKEAYLRREGCIALPTNCITGSLPGQNNKENSASTACADARGRRFVNIYTIYTYTYMLVAKQQKTGFVKQRWTNTHITQWHAYIPTYIPTYLHTYIPTYKILQTLHTHVLMKRKNRTWLYLKMKPPWSSRSVSHPRKLATLGGCQNNQLSW